MALVYLAGDALETPDRVALHAPWDHTPLGTVGQADLDLARRAVTLAHDALPHTARLPAHVRRDLLRAISDGITARADALARTITLEAGKPISFSRSEVERAAVTFALGAEEATRLADGAQDLDHLAASAGAFAVTRRVPAGVVVAITPFNFPLNLVAHKLAPAFALGAPVVLKPAPQTPLTAMSLASIVREACDRVGVPRALLSVLPCANDVAESLVTDPRVAVVSFTGSAAVGWSLRAKAPKKRVLLELGGNAAVIVCADADVDRALARVIPGAYGYAGQVCIKVQRALVHADLAEAFFARLAEGTAATRVGDPHDDATVCGPMIDERAAARVRAWIDESVEGGATVVTGGERAGNRLTPALLTGARAGMKVVDEEVFGPVLVASTFTHLDEAVAEVNRGRYGLQTGIFTHDVRTIARAYRDLEVGALVVDDAPTFRADAMPYGGVKDSGMGREGVRYAVEEMSERRALVLRRFLG